TKNIITAHVQRLISFTLREEVFPESSDKSFGAILEKGEVKLRTTEYGAEMSRRVASTFRVANFNPNKAIDKMKKNYDQKHVPVFFKIGQIVLVFKPVLQKNQSKKLRHYLGVRIPFLRD
ncbi:hypothetical protein O9G_004632, partial [Rozella allomycis CSF55]